MLPIFWLIISQLIVWSFLDVHAYENESFCMENDSKYVCEWRKMLH